MKFDQLLTGELQEIAAAIDDGPLYSEIKKELDIRAAKPKLPDYEGMDIVQVSAHMERICQVLGSWRMYWAEKKPRDSRVFCSRLARAEGLLNRARLALES